MRSNVSLAISEKEDCARKVGKMKKDMEEHRRDSEEREQRVENAVKTARLELTMRRAQLEEMAKEASTSLFLCLCEWRFMQITLFSFFVLAYFNNCKNHGLSVDLAR